jgi:glucosyl-3-phosphoglycerate synthase
LGTDAPLRCLDAFMREHVRTFPFAAPSLPELVAAKAGRSISVCLPARDEERTVGPVVAALWPLHDASGTQLVDEILVVDDGSRDATAARARAAGARVVRQQSGGDKAAAMRAGLDASVGDIVVFLDADVENTTELFVTRLVAPLLMEPAVVLVKGYYDRPIDGAPTGGGRVTELVARPVIELLFPELAHIRQPLAGETAAHRWALEKLTFADGYGVELGLLVDVARRFGIESIAQVDLGVRIHRNRPLDELRPQARDVLRAALARHRDTAAP